jgi:hypothetical protein
MMGANLEKLPTPLRSFSKFISAPSERSQTMTTTFDTQAGTAVHYSELERLEIKSRIAQSDEDIEHGRVHSNETLLQDAISRMTAYELAMV